MLESEQLNSLILRREIEVAFGGVKWQTIVDKVHGILRPSPSERSLHVRTYQETRDDIFASFEKFKPDLSCPGIDLNLDKFCQFVKSQVEWKAMTAFSGKRPEATADAVFASASTKRHCRTGDAPLDLTNRGQQHELNSIQLSPTTGKAAAQEQAVDSAIQAGATAQDQTEDAAMLRQVASDRNGYHLLQQRIRSRILCSHTAADRIVQNCRLNGITTLEDLSSTDACILSERLGVLPSDIQQLTCSEVQFQASVQSFLKTMQQENFDIEMLQDAAEAISKIAGTVQGLQGVTVMELAAVGVHVKVRVWLAQHRLIQGSGKKGQEDFSVQALAAIQESASDLRYVSMESAVLEVKKTLDDGFEPQHLSALTETETLNESRHKNSIEYGQYTERGIFVADGIPSTRDEHAAANLALRDQGFMLIDTTSVVHEVVNSSDFKRKEGGRLFEAVCLEESAAPVHGFLAFQADASVPPSHALTSGERGVRSPIAGRVGRSHTDVLACMRA